MSQPGASHMDPLRRFFQQHVPAAADMSLQADTPLLGSGLLDSLTVIQLMVFLGEQFGIEIEDEDFAPENLGTIGNLIDFVQRKEAQRA
jgi:acyl carrier protein